MTTVSPQFQLEISESSADFDKANASDWTAVYDLTQPLIVPAAKYYDAIGGAILHSILQSILHATSTRNRFRMLVPGSGPGHFVADFLDKYADGIGRPIDVVCVDRSQAMMELCHHRLKRTFASRSFHHAIKVQLISGVDLVRRPSDDQVLSLFQPNQYDAIVSLQFEHYFPNSSNSPLSQRMQDAKESFLTKLENLQRYKHSLRTDGHVFMMDDFVSSVDSESARWSKCWDEFVVERFSDPDVIGFLMERNPTLGSRIVAHYASEKDLERKVELAKRGRIRRRNERGEELLERGRALQEFNDVFCDRAVKMAQPYSDTHPGFGLFTAEPKLSQSH